MRHMKKLKSAFLENDIEYADVSKELNRSIGYVEQRMNRRRKYSFTIDDVYIICKMANIPHEKIPEYFPPMERS